MKAFQWLMMMAGGLLLVACAPQRPPATEGSQADEEAVERRSAEASRLDRLGESVTAMREATSQLPGRSADANRMLVGRGLEALARSIGLLSGADPVGSLRQQAAIVRQSAQRLLEASGPMRTEPVVDTALRAAARALRSVNGAQFADEQIEGLLDTMDGMIKDLDVVRGPIHEMVVAQVLRQSTEVVTAMQGRLAQRLAPRPEAPSTTTAPASDAPSE